MGKHNNNSQLRVFCFMVKWRFSFMVRLRWSVGVAAAALISLLFTGKVSLLLIETLFLIFESLVELHRDLAEVGRPLTA